MELVREEIKKKKLLMQQQRNNSLQSTSAVEPESPQSLKDYDVNVQVAIVGIYGMLGINGM